MAHLSMDPYLGAAHAFGDFGREWVGRAELKQLMERFYSVHRDGSTVVPN